jgi:hypothetical protein
MLGVPMAFAPQITPQYYDRSGSSSSNSYLQPQSQYLSSPYLQSQPQPQQQPQQQPQRIADDYNYNRNYYIPSQRDYQEPLYGYPTFHGDYNPKPYYFAQPSYMTQDDRMETTNPLDYLQAEIYHENERERSNAAFMQNLALYNQKLDSLQERQRQLQDFENQYNLKPSSEFDDYEIDQPSDWYDSTSIVVEPNPIDNYISIPSEPQFQYQQWQPHSSDYDDEMVKELRELKEMKQQRKNAKKGKQQQRVKSYGNLDWQQDMPQSNDEEEEDVIEPENYDDEWINWGGQKRSIQPKKEAGEIKGTSTIAPSTTTTEKSKIIAKLQSKTAGQKEVFLPRPATPVRRPFSEAIMKSMESQDVKSEQQQTPPIYRTIKQIIDMEQNLSHVSKNHGRVHSMNIFASLFRDRTNAKLKIASRKYS